MTLHATPSALAGYAIDSYVITPTYKSEGGQYTVGLVHLYEYYTQTRRPARAAARCKGFPQYEKLRPGRDGTPITVRTYEYTEHSAIAGRRWAAARIPAPPVPAVPAASSNSFEVTIYPLAKETRYRNEDGTGAIETSYTYTWHTDTLADAGAGDHAAGHCRSAERLRASRPRGPSGSTRRAT